MRRSGEIKIAWPEDYVLVGEELENLQALLAPRAEKIGEILGRTALSGSEIDIVNEAEIAVKDTIGFLSRPVIKRDLRNIIIACWNRSDVAPVDYGIRLKRNDIISPTISSLMCRGEVRLTDDLLLTLPPETLTTG